MTLVKEITLWCGGDSMAWSQFTAVFLGLDIGVNSRSGVQTEGNWLRIDRNDANTDTLTRTEGPIMDAVVGKEIGHVC